MSPLTFMHLANHGARNIGNAALILGLERVLREDLPGDVEFLREPWDLYSRFVRFSTHRSSTASTRSATPCSSEPR